MKTKLVELGEICVLINGDRGKNYPSQADIVDNGEIPFVNAGHLVENQINFGQMNYISRDKFDKLSSGKIIVGDILYCLRGSLGKKAIVTGINEGAIASSLVIIRPNQELVSSKYLSLALESSSISTQLFQANNGSSQPNLSAKSVREFKIALHNIQEQDEIVTKISTVKRMIDNRKEQLSLLDNLIKSRFVEMFVDKYEKIKVSTILRTTSGGTPKSDESEYYSNGTIPWLTSGEVNQGRIEKTEKYITEKGLVNSSAKWIPKKSIVIAMYGATAGKVGIIEMPTTTNQAVCAVLPHDEYNPEYLRFAFEYISDELAGKAVGGGQPNISQAIIKDSFIFNPPLEVQRKFSVFVEQVDKLKYAVQKSLDVTQILFDSLMQEYF